VHDDDVGLNDVLVVGVEEVVMGLILMALLLHPN
jgi:hypothetical protein